MVTRDPLELAIHYQAKARHIPEESHYWSARSLYFGRRATHAAARTGNRDGRR